MFRSPEPLEDEEDMQGHAHGGLRGARLIRLALGAALLAASVSACSSSAPEREYATPGDLCGAKVSRAALEPLLPPGEKITAQSTSGAGAKRCRLEVDGEVAFSSSVEKRAAGASAQDVATSAIGVEPTDSASDDGRFVYSKTGAVGRVECPASAGPDGSLWVTARATHPATAADMLDVVKEYADSVGQGGDCDER